MKKLVTYRLALAVPQLVVIALLVFFLTYLVPGSPAAAILGVRATPQAVADLEAKLGLDQPLFARLGDWFAGAITGDLGNSYASAQPVAALMADRLPATLSLVLGGITVAALLGVGLGILAGARPGSLTDRAVGTLTSLGLAIPEFWVGLVLVSVFAVQLGWIPVIAYTPITEDPMGWLRGILLPSFALGISAAALIARQMRGSMAQVLSSRYVDTLTAVGVSRTRIVLRYGVKNALVPVLAATGITFSILIGASFVVEKVFAVPGIGTLLLTSVIGKDFPVVQGGILLIAILVIAVNLVLDISYGLLNPKARPQ